MIRITPVDSRVAQVMAASTGSARLHRLGLLFLALVTTASYTANLAAFLTNPRHVVRGPKNLDDMKCAMRRPMTRLRRSRFP